MGAGGVVRAIGVESVTNAHLGFFKLLEYSCDPGLLARMLQAVEHENALEDIPAHLGGRHDGRNRNPIVAVNIAVDACQVEEDSPETHEKKEQNDSERGEELLSQTQTAEPRE